MDIGHVIYPEEGRLMPWDLDFDMVIQESMQAMLDVNFASLLPPGLFFTGKGILVKLKDPGTCYQQTRQAKRI